MGADTASLASDLSNTWNKIDAAAKMRSREDLGKAVADGLGSFDKAKASIPGRVALTLALILILTPTLALTLTTDPNPSPDPDH